MVAKERLESVMTELDQALHRETQSQSLLSEQSFQLKELARQLDNQQADREHLDKSAKFAIKVWN